MRVIDHIHRPTAAFRAENGVTMIIAMLVMLVTSLLLVAAFTAANGDTNLSHIDLTQKQAYYAALAGAQEYEYKLEASPDYWETCPEPKGPVPGEPSESYAVTMLAASSAPSTENTCSEAKPPANPFKTLIESKGALANTFRIKSIGRSGTSKRSLIATFQVAGFLDYSYFTQYEDADPESYGSSKPECANYRAKRKALGINCETPGHPSGPGTIYFGSGDSVNGPMHTDDTAVVCGGVEFGRKARLKEKEPDAVEMNGGPEPGGCGSGNPIYNTTSGKPETKGPELVAPESDGSLKAYVEHEPQSYEFSGRTLLVLEGEKSPAKIKVTTFPGGVKKEQSIEWPKNGLIYIKDSESGSGCEYTKFEQENTDTTTTYKKEENCGSVYVKGTYSSSLTIAAEKDIIIYGNIEETGVTPPAPPSGTTTLGLIATRFIRVYHPCSGGNNSSSGPAGGYLQEPWIYAAILSTSHSFLVDNYSCGRGMGNLDVYGAIAQKFRGIVGILGGGGYEKEYIYDERLATDEPPYFLAPLKAGWRIERQTAPEGG
jgi:hypothetical protein